MAYQESLFFTVNPVYKKTQFKLCFYFSRSSGSDLTEGSVCEVNDKIVHYLLVD